MSRLLSKKENIFLKALFVGDNKKFLLFFLHRQVKRFPFLLQLISLETSPQLQFVLARCVYELLWLIRDYTSHSERLNVNEELAELVLMVL